MIYWSAVNLACQSAQADTELSQHSEPDTAFNPEALQWRGHPLLYITDKSDHGTRPFSIMGCDQIQKHTWCYMPPLCLMNNFLLMIKKTTSMVSGNTKCTIQQKYLPGFFSHKKINMMPSFNLHNFWWMPGMYVSDHIPRKMYWRYVLIRYASGSKGDGSKIVKNKFKHHPLFYGLRWNFPNLTWHVFLIS